MTTCIYNERKMLLFTKIQIFAAITACCIPQLLFDQIIPYK